MNKQDLEIWFQRKCAELVGTDVYANINWALPLMRAVEISELPGHLVDEMPWNEDDIREAYDKLSYTQIELPAEGCELLGEGWEFSGGWNELYRSQERGFRDALEEVIEELEQRHASAVEKADEIEAELLDLQSKSENDEDWEAEQIAFDKATEEAEELEALVDEWRDVEYELDRADWEEQEVYECWLVSPWLAARLEEQGAAVVDGSYSGKFWLRTTTGQAISIDGVIRTIVKELLKDRGEWPSEEDTD